MMKVFVLSVMRLLSTCDDGDDDEGDDDEDRRR